MSKKRLSLFKFKTRRQKIISGVVIALIFLVVYVFVNMFIFYSDFRKTYAQAKTAYDAVKMQNVALAKEEFVKTQKDIAVLKRDLVPIAFVGYIPLVGGYYNDVGHMVNAADHGVKA